MRGYEEKLIGQAPEERGGSSTRATGLLGPNHRSLIWMPSTRHRKLRGKRTPPEKRLRSILKNN